MTGRKLVAAVVVLAWSALALHAQDPAKAAVKKIAESLVQATLTGDFAKVIDHTHDPIIKEIGGRDSAIRMTQTQMEQLKAQMIVIKEFKLGEVGAFHSEGAWTFVLIPTSMELTFSGGKIRTKSYLLGLSADQGKSWKFADGAGISNPAFRDKVLPKLPAKLKLPEPQQPEIIRDN
jgi:hypothetical protein